MSMQTMTAAARTPLPSVRDVRAHIDEASRVRSTGKGVTLFVVAAALYAAVIAATLSWHGVWAAVALAGINAVCIAILFVIGHDACHGSLTPLPWLNRVIGRLAFLPSLHPYAAWEHSHNGLHHAWTNVRSKDPGYPPYSKADFDRLPAWRRLLERVYRTAPGLGLFYLVEVWWAFEIAPREKDRPRNRGRAFQADRLLVVAFALLQCGLLWWSAARVTGTGVAGACRAMALGAVLPFALWNWIMGFVTFQHHTHPAVPWYADEREWSFFAAQVRSVVHVEFPRPIELVLHNIMDHTAHHVDPKIPLYNLPGSQDQLERAYADEIVVQKWTFGGFRRTLATCKLYDYAAHRWLDFAGNPTTEPLLPTAAVPHGDAPANVR